MKKIIRDCFSPGGERLYTGERLLQAVREHGDCIDLSNGVTIMGNVNGRYYNEADDFDRYAAVYDCDEDDGQGELIGFVQLNGSTPFRSRRRTKPCPYERPYKSKIF